MRTKWEAVGNNDYDEIMSELVDECNCFFMWKRDARRAQFVKEAPVKLKAWSGFYMVGKDLPHKLQKRLTKRVIRKFVKLVYRTTYWRESIELHITECKKGLRSGILIYWLR